MAVFLRGSSYYVKIRVRGRQVLRSLETTDPKEAKAKARARAVLEALSEGVDTTFDTTSIDAPTQTGTQAVALGGSEAGWLVARQFH